MNKNDRQKDQELLIDYLCGNCDPAACAEIEKRLESDAQFKVEHDNLSRAFGVMDACPEIQAPDDLVEKTLAGIKSFKRTEELIAREETHGRTLRPMFSLRELGTMVAAAILLAFVVIPMVKQSRMQSYRRNCAANLGRIGTAISGFASDNNGQLPHNEKNKVWLPQNGQPSYSNSQNMFKLVQGRYAPAQIFICPADKNAAPKILRINPRMMDFPSSGYISFSYQHTGSQNRRITSKVHSPGRLVILSDKTPLFTGNRFLPDQINSTSSENHNRKGHNVLFFDRHVDWKKTPNVGVDQDNIYRIQGVNDYRGYEAPKKPTDTFLLPAWTKTK